MASWTSPKCLDARPSARDPLSSINSCPPPPITTTTTTRTRQPPGRSSNASGRRCPRRCRVRAYSHVQSTWLLYLVFAVRPSRSSNVAVRRLFFVPGNRIGRHLDQILRQETTFSPFPLTMRTAARIISRARFKSLGCPLRRRGSL
ncbi:hypothetical protein BDZ89DRAFT_731792 [Hymenopellis radicata]|nr:hypothetical protein BDZ89DRAFT_731792 [Hymenopellis radicata]